MARRRHRLAAGSVALPALLPALLLALLLALRGLPARGADTADAGPQANAAERDVVVVNHARLGMNELYLSPSSSEDWGDDRLGEATLEPGRSVRLRMGRSGECQVDLQAVYRDGSREEKHNIDACRNRQISFDGTAIVAPAVAASDRHRVILINDSGRPVQQAFVSPATASDWGDDLLGGTSLSAGDRATLSYRGGCLADLRVVFNNRSAEERRDLDLCALGGVRLYPGWTTADTLPPIPATATPAAPEAAATR